MKYIVFLICFMSFALPCFAEGPFVFTDDYSVHVNGEMRFHPGSYILFGDGSIQTTATVSGPPGPQGLQGVPGPPGPPGSAFLTAADMISIALTRKSTTDFVNTWFTQGNTWNEFSPVFEVSFLKNLNDSRLRLTWSDTVGIFNNNWCNIGLFFDGSSTPACSASWAGVKNTSIFNTQHFHCIVENIPAGQHVVKVKHRSQYCNYGNFAFDSFGLDRSLYVEENVHAN